MIGIWDMEMDVGGRFVDGVRVWSCFCWVARPGSFDVVWAHGVGVWVGNG